MQNESSLKNFNSPKHAFIAAKEREGLKHECVFGAAPLMLATLLLASHGSSEPDTPLQADSAKPNKTSLGCEPIKVACIFALTGDESPLDLPASKGAKLAAKEINAGGGILGCPLELVLRDSEYKMDVASISAKQLIEQDLVVAGIGFTEPGSVLAASPAFQAAGLPFITVGATSPRIPQQIGDLIYLACFGDNAQAAAGAEYAAKNFGRKAYLLYNSGNVYTRLLAGYFKNRFAELGGRIYLEDAFEDNATDFSMQIDKLKSMTEQMDFYYISAMPYNIGHIVRQFRDAGIDGPIVGGDGYDTPDLLNVAGNASDSVYFSTHALIDRQQAKEGVMRFITSYNKVYGHDPENSFAALGYDTVYLLADAVSRARSTNPEAIRKAISDTKGFAGITGTISYPNGAHVPQKDVTIIAIREGRFTLAAELTPERVPDP
jgi:branched-chain amino acid transport system substrate-binding protein